MKGDEVRIFFYNVKVEIAKLIKAKFLKLYLINQIFLGVLSVVIDIPYPGWIISFFVVNSSTTRRNQEQ